MVVYIYIWLVCVLFISIFYFHSPIVFAVINRIDKFFSILHCNSFLKSTIEIFHFIYRFFVRPFFQFFIIFFLVKLLSQVIHLIKNLLYFIYVYLWRAICPFLAYLFINHIRMFKLNWNDAIRVIIIYRFEKKDE